MSEKVVEELQELLACQGWTIFKALVAELYGDEAVVAELSKRANNTTRLDELGMQAAVVLSTQQALRNILNLPEAKIAEIEQAGRE